MNQDVDRLLQLIGEGNPFQKQYIEKMRNEVMGRREYENLEFLTGFFCAQGISVEQQAEAYSAFGNAFMEEQLYFRRNHKYSKNNYREICQAVYENNEYMSRYMVALAISGCIWSDHIHILRWYEEEIKSVCKNKINNYLEIGCGMGINMLHTMQATNAKKYQAADLSEKSVELSKTLLAYAKEKGLLSGKEYTVKCKDFFAFMPEEKADVFTMFEVLEHVPNPKEMLERIKYVTTENAEIFVSTAINSPAPDHIYLFRNTNEIVNMIKDCGFSVENMLCAPSNGVTLEIAERKELPITIALRLKRKN